MRTILLLTFSLIFFGCTPSSSSAQTDAVYQLSTIDALLAGGLDGSLDYGSIKQKGDFGLGTFDRLDGEMVALDGHFFQIKADGSAHAVADSMTAPFVTVKHFVADTSLQFTNLDSLKRIFEELDALLPSPNLIYAVHISGHFGYIKTRSVPGQSKPYPPVAEIISHQPTFEFEEIRGDMIGFRFPAYASSINASPWHFHFITEDRSSGGHILMADIQEAKVLVDISRNLNLSLPDDPFFNSVNLDHPAE